MKVYPAVESIVPTTWKILVIDDDEDDFIIARDMLKEAKGRKFDVQWASTYEAGREALLSNQFKAVLVDYDLGLHTGIHLIREINARGYASPLILFTGRGSYELDVEAMEAGATLYLTKSEVNSLLLERGIRYAIELKQKEQSLRDSEAKLGKNSAALRVTEERFHKAFNASPNAQVLSRKEDGTIEIVNDRFEHMFGYRRDEVIGKTSLELNLFSNPADREEVIRKLQADGSLRDFVVGIRTKSGDVRLASVSIEIISIVNDEGLILTIIEDITERKRAEAGLQESEARLRALVSASVQVLYRMSPDWSEMRQLEGGNFLADTEKPNSNWMAEYIHPDDQNWVGAVIENAVRTGTVFELEHQVLRADGTIGWTASRAVPVRNAEGEIVEWFGAASDITERKRAEQALQEKEALLEAFFANSPGILNIVDTEFRYIKSDPTTPTYFGLDRQSLVGKRVGDLAPEFVESFGAMMRRVIETGQPEQMMQVQSPVSGRTDLMTYWLASYFQVPLLDGKKGLGVMGVDITERKQAEAEQQEQAIQIEVQRRLMDQREQDRSTIARDLHDGPIQTLSSTMFHLQMIKDVFPDPVLQTELHQFGMDIKNTINELRDVMNNLRPPALITFGFSKVLQQYIEDFRPRFPDLEIDLNIAGDDTILSAQAHLTLFRIFQAGINNIIRHSNASKIWVVYSIAPENFYFELRDNGVGFELKNDLSQLTRDRHFGLVGMRERAEAIGAEFSVSSKPGKGTTIVVNGSYNVKNLT